MVEARRNQAAAAGAHPLVRLALLLAACVACSPQTATGPPERIVLIVIDTLRRDHVGVYDGAPATPNIDALARDGVIYRHAYSSYHQTSMSMGALFTGRTPSIEFGTLAKPLFWSGETWCGLNRFASGRGDDICVPPDVPTLAQLLERAGYWTIGIASNQFLYEPSGFGRGYDDWVEVGEHPAQKGALARLEIEHGPETRHAAEVVSAAEAALRRRESDRLFLYVHFMDVHDYGYPAGRAGGTGGSLRERYAASVEVVDHAVGQLLDALRGEGLLEDALVVLTADHGERLGERHAIRGKPAHVGNPSFQEHLEIPLIAVPALPRAADASVRTEDVFRLILEAAGVAAPAAPELEPDELLVTETEYRTYLRGRWKTVVRRSDAHGWLFDVESDPGELRDLRAEHPEIEAAHRERIESLSKRLSARNAVLERLTDDDRARLKALGYDYDPETPVLAD